ncbi:hypothetical protein H6G33_21210 [Calothrix sp. FACHB-1219]|uniref:hypothetical protein n=1 Tax=unclassified Calothrix TaxID=2619626 RepID=UPI001686652A|nr:MULTISPECIES: hypothetical protein [unclassified Calothrix]MBD2206868.1 hypothetical protein [Calothrix sp. FACHB-168]MBD2219539.1 hypothetical protein [Calothrix sp. FACHB-1219]
MSIYKTILWFNSLSLLLIIILILATKAFDISAGGLFLPPPAPQYPSAGLLTHTFQLLCCVPPLVCAFSFALLQKIKPNGKNNKFILSSAFLTAGFLINEIYRIHITALQFGIPKLVTVFIYATIAIAYGLTFRRQIKSTQYFILIAGLGLLAIAITVDSLKLSGNSIPSLLEGIPKLLSGLNVALYYWFVCYQEVLNSLHLEKDNNF